MIRVHDQKKFGDHEVRALLFRDQDYGFVPYFVLQIETLCPKVTGCAHSTIQYHLADGTRSEIEGALVEHASCLNSESISLAADLKAYVYIS